MGTFISANAARNKIDELCMIVGETIIGKDSFRNKSVDEFYRSIQSWVNKKKAEIDVYKK